MTTSDVKDAWTEGAQVAVVLCGEKCDSSFQPLITDDNRGLRRGCTANFMVGLLIVDTVKKLTVEIKTISKDGMGSVLTQQK